MDANIKIVHSQKEQGFYFVVVIQRIVVRSVKCYRTLKQTRKAAIDWCAELKIVCKEE